MILTRNNTRTVLVVLLVCTLFIGYLHLGEFRPATQQSNTNHVEEKRAESSTVSPSAKKTAKVTSLRDAVPLWLREGAKRVRNPYKGCQELYQHLDKANPYSPDYMVEIKAHNESYWKQPAVRNYFNNTNREPDGYSFKCCPAQILTFIDLARIPWVKTICEVGFNAGHSAVSWLAAKPGTKLYSFDLGYHDYTKPMGDYIKQRYPGRFELILGDSGITMPKFIKENPSVKCDLMSIDGGHFYKYAIHDFNNFRQMANPTNILHFDDYPMGDIPVRGQDLGRVWEEKLEVGELEEIFRCSFHKDNENLIGMKGFSVGQIIV